MLAQIIRLVEQAQGSKLPIQAVVDKVTLWFVPMVMLIAALTFVVWLAFGPSPALTFALINGVAVLIIACPCAMGWRRRPLLWWEPVVGRKWACCSVRGGVTATQRR